ncbi:hypothetical protein AAG906_009002 [Vitis piasezkii]
MEQIHSTEDDILIDYAMGLYLRPSLKWSEVDVIYVPINLRNTHWVLGVVHLRSRRIYIYDSLKSINKPNRLKTLVTPMTMLLPRILSATKYYGENEYMMHNHPMDTLTGEQMDWFHKKMAVKLFFHKELPM